jgi:hypothetical protein
MAGRRAPTPTAFPAFPLPAYTYKGCPKASSTPRATPPPFPTCAAPPPPERRRPDLLLRRVSLLFEPSVIFPTSLAPF